MSFLYKQNYNCIIGTNSVRALIAVSTSSIVFSGQKLKRIVRSNKSFSSPIDFNVSLIAGLFDEQAEPADT